MISTAVTVDRLASFLKAHLEHPLRVTVERHRSRRSTTANARLWTLHTLAADVTGYSPEEMHEFALCRHWGSEEIKVGGIIMRRPLKRSSTRDTKEFAEFMSATEVWYGQEFGVWLEG